MFIDPGNFEMMQTLQLQLIAILHRNELLRNAQNKLDALQRDLVILMNGKLPPNLVTVPLQHYKIWH